ncbi:hypothetical protein [Morganella morganii]|uniref:hypothetical protein n=1 Tax=Morganella morganii TaxID=582 RepID=UPI0021CE50B3|nr:hypothetical protein [Morganella morganii]MCU6374954.1 hypothetical protein [Morganella morganii]
MTTIFVAGSIKIKVLDPLVTERLKKITARHLRIIVGDAAGADSAIQQFLKQSGYHHVTVFSSSPTPRNNLGNWPVQVTETPYAPGSRAFFTAKDLAMAAEADYGLMIWDSRSTGTLSNVLELLNQKKYSVVFIRDKKQFIVVKSPDQLSELVSHMPPDAFAAAEKKIQLSEKITQLKNRQITLFG